MPPPFPSPFRPHPLTYSHRWFRGCKYPQELVLLLDRPAALTQLQLLSHEFKVASKVELAVAMLPPEASWRSAVFKRLGTVSFDPNHRSQFAARELKTVALPGVHAALLRLVVLACHPNPLNNGNQVTCRGRA
jgi:centrosomal protein CEP104